MLNLSEDDPTIFAKCPSCDSPHGKGAKVKPTYFGKAYTDRSFRRQPLCENCGTPMEELFRVRRGR